MARQEIRDQVIGQIMQVMLAARERGQDEMAVARNTFHGTPDGVLWEAWIKIDSDEQNAWWSAVEKTIDGEIIRRALIEQK